MEGKSQLRVQSEQRQEVGSGRFGSTWTRAHWHLSPGTHRCPRRCGLNVRQALFMDEGERAAVGISEEHQVPVRTPLGRSSAEQGRLPWHLPPPARPAHQSLPQWVCRACGPRQPTSRALSVRKMSPTHTEQTRKQILLSTYCMPGVGKWKPTAVFLPRKSQGQRSLAGYSPRGCKESDTTEHENYCMSAGTEQKPSLSSTPVTLAHHPLRLREVK